MDSATSSHAAKTPFAPPQPQQLLTAYCCAAIFNDPRRPIRDLNGCLCPGAGRARPLSPGRGVAATLSAGIVIGVAVLGCGRDYCLQRLWLASLQSCAARAP